MQMDGVREVVEEDQMDGLVRPLLHLLLTSGFTQ